MIPRLDESSFQIYAAKSYDNKNCMDILEFQEDLSRIKYIKRLFKKYDETKMLKERLVLNHLIVFYNVFDNSAATRILVFRLEEYLRFLKPFLEFLNYWPDKIENIGFDGITIYSDDIDSDEYIMKTLRGI